MRTNRENFKGSQVSSVLKVIDKLNASVGIGVFTANISSTEIDITYSTEYIEQVVDYFYVDEDSSFPSEEELVDRIYDSMMKMLEEIKYMDYEIRSNLGWGD